MGARQRRKPFPSRPAIVGMAMLTFALTVFGASVPTDMGRSAVRVCSSALSKCCDLQEQFHNDPSAGVARTSLVLSKPIACSSGPEEHDGRCADHHHDQNQYQDGRQQHYQKRPARGRRVHLPYAHGGQVEPVQRGDPPDER